MKTTWPTPVPKQVVQRLDVHRACCSVRTCAPFSSARIAQGEPVLLGNGRGAAVSATRRCVLWRRVFRRLPLASLSPTKEQAPVTSSIKQSPVRSTSSASRQSGGCSVGYVEAGKCFSPKSEGECSGDVRQQRRAS